MAFTGLQLHAEANFEGNESKHLPAQTLSDYASAKQSSSHRHHWRNLLKYNQQLECL